MSEQRIHNISINGVVYSLALASLLTPRSITLTGAMLCSFTFDGSQDVEVAIESPYLTFTPSYNSSQLYITCCIHNRTSLGQLIIGANEYSDYTENIPNGAQLRLTGGSYDNKGAFAIIAANTQGSTEYPLQHLYGDTDGNLTWGNRNIVWGPPNYSSVTTSNFILSIAANSSVPASFLLTAQGDGYILIRAPHIPDIKATIFISNEENSDCIYLQKQLADINTGYIPIRKNLKLLIVMERNAGADISIARQMTFFWKHIPAI